MKLNWEGWEKANYFISASQDLWLNCTDNQLVILGSVIQQCNFTKVSLILTDCITEYVYLKL